MARPPSRTRQPGWTRFGLGTFVCTAVSDGKLDLKMPPRSVVVGQGGTEIGGTEIDDLLTAEFLSVEERHFDQNMLVISTGEHLVLFDAGSGADPDFGTATFGPSVGQLPANLRASGIEPDEIDIVCLSHLHPDHCWGLVDGGAATFPNASIAVPAGELDVLDVMSRRPASSDMSPEHRRAVIGARNSLTPYVDAGRVRRLADGERVVPGITAQAAPGHSPGHMIYRVESDGRVLMVLGDVAHHHVLLLAHPEWGTIYDHDRDLAARTRARVLREVIEARAAVHAYHFPFPGLGHLQARHGRFRWLPSPLELADPRHPTDG